MLPHKRAWDETTRQVVSLMAVPGVGPTRLRALVEAFGSAAAAWNASSHQLLEVVGPRTTSMLLQARRHPPDVESVLQRAQDIGALMVTLCHDSYPGRLLRISDPPPLLYVHGDVAVLSSRSVAVVGTRGASDYGRLTARRIAAELAESGCTIVSGLARGIDGIAHRAALDVGGTTVAVLGSGLDVPYPHDHARLMTQIAAVGAVVSEYPPGTRPEPFHFPARNRIVSGLCDATVVVEAGQKSGALITARLALEEGRDVFAVPGRLTDRRAAGTNDLLAHGAGIARSAQDVLDALSIGGLRSTHVPRITPENDTQATLLARLRLEPMHIDELIRETAIDGAEVIRALSMMEVKGWVEHMGNMQWTAIR